MEQSMVQKSIGRWTIVFAMLLIVVSGCSKNKSSSITSPDDCVAACKTNFWELAKKSSLFEQSLNTENVKILQKLKERIFSSTDFKSATLLTSGINFFEPTYFYLVKNNDSSTWFLMGFLASDKHFENFLTSTFSKKNIQTDNSLRKQYQFVTLQNITIAWNKSRYVIAEQITDSIKSLAIVEQLLGLSDSKSNTPGIEFLFLDKSDVSIWINPHEMPISIIDGYFIGKFLPLLPKNHSVNISIDFVNGGYTVTIHGKTPGMNENFLKFLTKQAETNSEIF